MVLLYAALPVSLFKKQARKKQRERGERERMREKTVSSDPSPCQSMSIFKNTG